MKDRLNILLWYIGSYSLRWGRSLSVPLSESQLQLLNDPLPVDDFPESISVALWNLLRRDRPDLLDVTKPNVENEAVYWWCLEKTPHLNLEWKLVTPQQISVLQRIDQEPHSRFPLTTFMRMYIERNSELNCLNLHSSAGRLAAMHYFIVLACKDPHIVRFLPQSQLKGLLGSQASLRTFELNLTFLLRDDQNAAEVGVQVRRDSLAIIAAMDSERIRAADVEGATVANDASIAADGVTVIGPIEKTSGLGQATRLSYLTLERIGIQSLSVIPFNIENPALVGFSSKIAYKRYTDPHRINLFHLNAEAIPLAFTFLSSSTFKDSYNIGYFFWELNKMPEAHFLALDLLDEIWVSSEYVKRVYAAQTVKPVINVGMAVEDLPLNLKPHDGFHWDGKFTFLTTFDSFSFAERKNPLAAVRAFQSAFDKYNRSVALIIKTWNKSRVSQPSQVRVWQEINDLIKDDTRIQVIDETFTYEQILSAKMACDCYVSLHRAEGFGFGMLEAMQLGRPVIATAYSGNMDFCTPDNSYLVDYDLVPVGYEEYPAVERGSVWADPQIASAAEAMRHVVTNRDEAMKRGAHAAQLVKANFSIDAISQRYNRRLSEITSLRQQQRLLSN
jgi:glycosyltransferase involved in cell wall biosynthesis